MIKEDRRLIEDIFPFEEVGVHSAKEKYIRKGNITTFHPWWARRPLAASRTSCYSTLIKNPVDEAVRRKKIEFVIEFAKWDNTLNRRMIEIARKDILITYGERNPKILDPFAGGGSIPLECLRLGCETYSSDLNPVAVLLQKCILEFPQLLRYENKSTTDASFFSSNSTLVDDVKEWALWIQEKAIEKLGKYYSPDEGMKTVGFLWARTIPCQNPVCGLHIPLMRNYWLSKKNDKSIALQPYKGKKVVSFKIVGEGHDSIPPTFNPDEGSVSGAIVKCPICDSMLDSESNRKLFRQGKSGEQMIAVVFTEKKKRGKYYRIPTERDLEEYQKACQALEKKNEELTNKWGIDSIPTEEIHTPIGKEYKPGQPLYNFTPVLLYGKTKWRDLYNSRQLLAMITFTDIVRQAYCEIKKKGYSDSYSLALTSYLAVLVSRMSNRMSSLAYWYVQGEKIQPTFVRQALAMTWDFIELNPFNESSGGWISNLLDCINVLEHLTSIDSPSHAIVNQSSATSLKYPDNYFDAVFTDPPYYDNVPYAVLSDYFYVWLKRSLGYLYPNLFSTPLTPKKGEIIAELPLLRGMSKLQATKLIKGLKNAEEFEKMLRASFQEIFRVLKPEGIALIVYAHKSTEGWESLINSLLDSGLVITGAWPINTELTTRLRAKESAALASSIYIVARKVENTSTGLYRDVRIEMEKYLEKRLESLWEKGVGGPDFLIAAIGSAIEVFGKYKTVIDYEGNFVRADKLLDDVQEIATKFAIKQILHSDFNDQVPPLISFYLLFRWNYKDAKVHFDEARKLAQSCGIDITEHWGETGFIQKSKEFIRVKGPKDRKITDLKGGNSLIDNLHYILHLWEKGRKDQISEILIEKNLDNNEMFWKMAQAIAETLPTQNKEKKLLDGFLVGRTGYQSDDRYEQETLE